MKEADIKNFNSNNTNSNDNYNDNSEDFNINSLSEKFNKNKITEESFNSLNKKNENEIENLDNEKKSEEMNKENIKNLIQSIFMNFSKFCKEEFEFLMPYQNLIKILRLVNLIGTKEEAIKEYEIDSIFKKANPKSKKFSLKNFENFLVFITNRLDPDFKNDPKLSMMKILQKYFQPLNIYIEEQITNKQNGDYFQHKIVQKYIEIIQIDNNTIYLLNSIHTGIKHIYASYFIYENNNLKEQNKIYKNSIEGLISFCKDFEIMNHIVSIEKIAAYFNFLIEMTQEEITKNLDYSLIFEKQKDAGKLFTLSKFAGFLVHIAIISFEKNSKILDNICRKKNIIDNGFSIENISNSEKLIILLDKFDSNSSCIEKLELKGIKGYSSKISLMPSKEVIKSINPSFKNLDADNNINLSSTKEILNSNYDSNKNPTNQNSEKDPKNIYTSINFIQNNKIYEKLNFYMENFKQIFDYYSTIGFKTDAYNMTISGFFKFATDAEIISAKEFGDYSSNKEKDIDFNSTLNLMKLDKQELLNRENKEKINNFSVKQTENTKGELFSLNKISKSELSLIFHNLSGVKNFDFSKKIKTQFDKNRGFNTNFESTFKGRSLDSRNLNSADNEMKFLKINFGLFLKSFELISAKIYKEISSVEAMDLFIDVNIKNILDKKSESLSHNKIYEDILENLRREDIVRNFFIYFLV